MTQARSVTATFTPKSRTLTIRYLNDGSGTVTANGQSCTGNCTLTFPHGTAITSVAWHPSGRQVVTASLDGIVRVGEMSGEEPHLLMGHEAGVMSLVVEPGGRWLASSAADGTVRQWPMPEGRPFQTLPREELLARLRALTNYRVVEDRASPSGYRLDVEPFAGWKREPPRW